MKIYIARMYWLIFEFHFPIRISCRELSQRTCLPDPHAEERLRESGKDYWRRESIRVPRYEVQPQMVEHWTGRRSLSRKSREDRKVRGKQYGTHVGLPIEGPPNWDEIWKEWPDIGTDHKTRFNLTKTLSEKELQIINRYSYKYKVIEFIDNILSGAFGSVLVSEMQAKDEKRRKEKCGGKGERRRYLLARSSKQSRVISIRKR